MMVHLEVLLYRQLGDAIGTDRVRRMSLVDGQIPARSVYGSSRGEEYEPLHVRLTASLIKRTEGVRFVAMSDTDHGWLSRGCWSCQVKNNVHTGQDSRTA